MTVAPINTADLAANDPDALIRSYEEVFAHDPRTCALNVAYAHYLAGFQAGLVNNEPNAALDHFRFVDDWATTAGEDGVRAKVREDVANLGLPVTELGVTHVQVHTGAPGFAPQFAPQFSPTT